MREREKEKREMQLRQQKQASKQARTHERMRASTSRPDYLAQRHGRHSNVCPLSVTMSVYCHTLPLATLHSDVVFLYHQSRRRTKISNKAAFVLDSHNYTFVFLSLTHPTHIKITTRTLANARLSFHPNAE